MDTAAAPAKVFRFGLFEADAAQNTLTRNGMRVKVQDQPFRVLLVLLDRPGEIVTREELKQKLWTEGTYVDFDGSLNVILKKLRAAIDDDSENPRFIETVPRRGYRFIAPVSLRNGKVEAIAPPPPAPTEVVAATPTVAAPESRAPESTRQPPRMAIRPRILVYAAAALVIFAGTLWFALHRGSAPASASGSPARLSVPIRKSIAVLGFHNISGNASDTWLATAFSEMLSTELAGGEELRLVSGEDVANLRISSPWSQTDTLDQKTTSRVGTALNSDLLVLGSYTIIGKPENGEVRFDIRLQDAKTGEIVSEIAEIGSTQDLFQIVSRAGSKLRDRLGLPRLDVPGSAEVLASMPRNREAARFYSLGLSKLRQFDFLGAKELLEEASRTEPKFCLAHGMLARAWAGLGYEQKRKEEAKRALDLSADLPRADQLLVQGEYYESLPDHEKAVSTYRVLFELFPDNIEYGLQLANVQHAAGRDNQALQTLSVLRSLPSPGSDDPRIDLLDARVQPPSIPVHLGLIRNAELKAKKQGKSLIYAEARKDECMNLNYSEHPEQAVPACEEAYNVYTAAGNRLMAADAIRLMGDTLGTLGHIEQAIATYQRALGLLVGMGEHHKTGSILNNMAIGFENEGKLDRAEQLYREAKVHFEAAGAKENTSTTLGNLGDIAFLRGDLAGAAKLFEQALEIENSLDRPDPLYLEYRLSDLALVQGRVHDARRLAEQAVESGRPQQGNYQYFTNAVNAVGEALMAAGDLQGARNQFDEALQIQQQAGENELLAETQSELAELDVEEGHPENGERLLRTAIAEFEKEHEDPDATSAYTLLSRSLRIQGKLDEARQAIQHALELGRKSPDPSLKLPAAIENARVGIAAGNAHVVSSARQELRSAIATAKKLGYYNLECDARLAMAELELKSNPTSGHGQLVSLAMEARGDGMELLARRAERAANADVNALAMNNSSK